MSELIVRTCLVRSYTNVCRDGVQSTLSVYMPGIQREEMHLNTQIKMNSGNDFGNIYTHTLTLDGRVCIDVGHGSLLQQLGIVLLRRESSVLLV